MFGLPTDREDTFDATAALYYLPVIYAVARFGLRGSLATAAVATIGYFPHFRLVWEESPFSSANQYAEVVVLFVVSAVSGMLSLRDSCVKSYIKVMQMQHKWSKKLPPRLLIGTLSVPSFWQDLCFKDWRHA